MFASSTLVYAQCPTIPSQGAGFATGASVTVYIDTSSTGFSGPNAIAIQQILTNWTGTLGVTLKAVLSPNGVPANTTGTTANPTWGITTGTVSSGYDAKTSYSYQTPTYQTYSATTNFANNWVATANPTNVEDLMGHEIVHTFWEGECVATATVSCAGVAANQTNNTIVTPSQCDLLAQKNNYGQPAPATSTSGGSGGNGSPPPTCILGVCPCTNCIPPSCPTGQVWNPAYCSCWIPSGYTPIIIDTDGTGFHLTSAANGVLFDFFGNGNPIQIAWTAQGSTNGWLALDRYGDGHIDSGTDLFGNITSQPPSENPNGFLALAVFDEPENGGNGDGIIDSRDAVWSKLLVWIDTNHDGISQPEELHPLDELGIHSISLRYRESKRVDAFGNQFRYRGWLDPDKGDNVNRVIYDVILTTEDRP
jgi:hypothetical protein